MVNRRDFLTTMAGAVAGAAALPTQSRAIEPFKRPGKSVLKLSLAAYSMRKYLQAKPGTKGAMDLPGFIDYCAKLGLDGTELTSYYFPKELSPEYLYMLKRQCRVAGLDISGGAIGNNYCLPPGPKLDEQIALTRTWIDRYADLGAGAIRVFAGTASKGETTDTAIKRCISVLEQVCDMAGKRGIMLALENHGGITTHATDLLKIVQGVKSPWLGINFDSGNFHSSDPYAELAMIAPYAVNAQVKVEMSDNTKKPAEKTPADFSRIVSILRDAGYSGWLALEYESEEDPYKAIPHHIEKLREVIGA